MKSMTLTKQMREDILKSVIEKWKEKNQEPDIKAAENDFAEYLWSDYFKKEKSLFDGVPSEFMNLATDMKYCVNGEVKQASLKDGNSKPVNWKGYRNPVLKDIRDTHKEYSKYNAVVIDHEKWRERGNEVFRETKAILESVNTTKQLLEIWPQCEPFIPAHIADPDKAIRLPAIEMSRLNERLGLK